MSLAAFAERIVLFWGFRRYAAAFLAGAASALAMAPFDLWPILAVTLPVAVWLIDGSSAAGPGWRSFRAAAVVGWWFGFGYFLAGLWWVGAAFLVDAAAFGWLMPLAVVGLPALLALFHAFGFALAWGIWSSGPWRILAFALAVGTAEFLRGTLLTGFPWNAFGYALADQTWLGQAASVVGVEGLTFLTLTIFSAPACLGATFRRSAAPVWVGAGLLAMLALFGAVRLHSGAVAAQHQVKLRIVQPRIAQDAKFRPEAGPEILDIHLGLSDTATSPGRRGLQDVGLLLWPESVFPFLVAQSPEALAEIGGALSPGTILVTGAARGERNRNGRLDIYNSADVILPDGTIADSYDKIHLVPFGEYLPFQSVLESLGIRQLTKLPGGFSAGQSRRNLVLPDGLKIRPLICYEAIFPSEAVGDDRPDVLFNLTNDGWYGRTPGPYQHLAIARVRSIEQGLPLLRAANTGISAIVDSYGTVIRSLSLGERGVLDGDLPGSLPPTIYARFGRVSTALLVFLMGIGYLVLRRRV